MQTEAFDEFGNGQHGARGAHFRGAFHLQLPMLELALLEQFFQARNGAWAHPARAALARVVLHQFGGVVLDHLATQAGGALERWVVDHHQFAVARQMQIQLAAVDAVFQAALETGQGIFRGFALGAAMAVDESHCYSLAVSR